MEFSERFAENLYTIPTFSLKTKWNLANCSGKLCYVFCIFLSG